MPVRAVHDRDYAKVPALLRAMREEAGLTQRDLAATLRRAQQTVHASETGSRRVDVAEFCRWAEACGVTPTDALDRYLRARPQRRA